MQVPIFQQAPGLRAKTGLGAGKSLPGPSERHGNQKLMRAPTWMFRGPATFDLPNILPKLVGSLASVPGSLRRVRLKRLITSMRTSKVAPSRKPRAVRLTSEKSSSKIANPLRFGSQRGAFPKRIGTPPGCERRSSEGVGVEIGRAVVASLR